MIIVKTKESYRRRIRDALLRTNEKKLLLISAVVAVSLAVYFNALFNGFVYDDDTQVLANAWIKDIRYIPEMFSSSVAGFDKAAGHVISNYFRPVMHLVYMFNYHVFGLKPWGFHLMNILIHAGVSALVFILADLLFVKSSSSGSVPFRLPPFLAAILFATHPIHTEAVTWIASLPELSFSFFSLLSLYLYIRYRDGSKNYYILSVLSFFVATLCKETALTLPLMLIVYDYAFIKKKERLAVFIKRYMPYFIVMGVYLAMRYNALGGLAPNKSHQELGSYQYFINIFPLFAQYMGKLILPINLNAYYVLHPVSSAFAARSIISFCIVTVFILLAVLALRKSKIAFLSLAFIAIPLLPVLYIPGVGENTFAERYLYFPSFGFALLLVWLLARTGLRLPKGSRLVIWVALVLIGLYSAGTISRNSVWKDDIILFEDTVKKSPDGAIPRGMLGYALAYRWHTDEAIEQYRISLALKPYNPVIHTNLGSAYAEKGFLDKAIEEFKIAIRLRPGYADAHYNLGQAYMLVGALDEAIKHFGAAARLNPRDPEYNSRLAYALRLKNSVPPGGR
jgi:tetratricopeptide (TPR) repeat protein